MRRALFGIAVSIAFLASARALAEPQEPPAIRAPSLRAPSLREEDVHLENATPAPTTLPEAPPEAPPAPPHARGFVLEGSLGALGFTGQFRHVAPPGTWLHTQLGYELFRWLMLFAEGELVLTDTSVSQDPTKVRAFPIFGFGAGARVTVHASERVAMFVQGSVGVMKADIAHNALGILGYKNAESLGLSLGARVGVEWYQIDRHMALGLGAGLRDAAGFARASGGDAPLAWDGSAAIRYTF